jgi:TolB-like protein
MNLKRILAELRRRNVFKVATAYAITGWLIIQIVTSISTPLSLPKWFDSVIIIFVLIGFPIALLFAWAFELTPDGLKKTKQVEQTTSIVKATGKKLNRLIITVLVIFLGFLVFERFFVHEHQENIETSIGLPSIAVLPFADMSPKNDQEYFSDGLSEELLNVLAKVHNIKVAGRTSSFKFKGKNEDLKKIGAELGVAHILEGSVRKSGNKIRITAQLIKVSDGFHMWSETYDKDYTANNLFKIQDEISKKILKELKIKLLVEDEKTKVAVLTNNTQAYEAYLKGNQLLINRNPKEIEAAIKQFQLAISLDITFAMAYARLATSYGHLFSYGSIKREIVFKNMRENVDKALLLDNTLGSAYAALGHYYKDKDQQFNEQNNISYKASMKKAYELEPNNPEIIMWYGNSIDADSDERIKMYLKAHQIDPLAPVIMQNMANTYKYRKEYEKATEIAKKNIELNPEFIRTRIFLIEMITTSPNSKLGEGFVEAYKTFKKHPENLDILTLLANLSSNLELFKIAEEMGEVITKVYPENDSFLGVRFNNLMNRKNYKEATKFIEDYFKKINLKEGTINSLGFEMFKNQISNQDPLISNAYIKKHHPIFFSDTITTFTSDEMYAILPDIITVFKNVKAPRKTIDKLLKIYISNVESQYEFDGDITKEKIFVLNKISNIALLKEDAKLYRKILNEIYFNRKDKFYNQHQIDLDPLYAGVKNTPEVKEIENRIKEDILFMRTKAIDFLKKEKVWEQYKE